jgi:hypothetical protein
MPRVRKGDEESRKGNEKPREDDGKQKPSPPGNPDADPVKIHREYVERRLGGGATATSDAYARALEQWHKLPGAVSTPASEIKPDNSKNPPEEEGGAQDGGADKERRP